MTTQIPNDIVFTATRKLPDGVNAGETLVLALEVATDGLQESIEPSRERKVFRSGRAQFWTYHEAKILSVRTVPVVDPDEIAKTECFIHSCMRGELFDFRDVESQLWDFSEQPLEDDWRLYTFKIRSVVTD